MHAVIKTGGKQYRVSPEDILTIEKIPGKAGDTVYFDTILMLGTGKDIKIAQPVLQGEMVSAEILEQRKGKKVTVIKKKARTNYFRKKGHRQQETVIKITDLAAKGKKASASSAKKTSAPSTKKSIVKTGKSTVSSATTPKGKAPVQNIKAKKPDIKAEKLTSAKKDDLKQLSGVGPVLEKKLHAIGVTHFKQIAGWTKKDIAEFDQKLNFKGRIERENWVEQARKLAEKK